MSDETTCDACGLTYFYAPRFHECVDPEERARDERAFLARSGRYSESWVAESMRKVGVRR